MRVLLDVSAVPDRPVGAGVYTVQLAVGLARRPLELHLLARHGDASRWLAHAPGATVHDEVPVGRPVRLLWEQVRGPQLAREIDPNVWHGPHYTMPLRLDVPGVVTVHDLTFFDHPEWHERSKVAYFRGMLRATARRASALVVVSEHTARRAREVLDTTAPLVVAPHGVDHERFRPCADASADLAVLRGLGVRAPYVAFAGTLEPRKDVPTLVAAFARIAACHPDLRLVLAGGDGWGAVTVREAVERSGVATRVLRPGYIPGEAVPALFRRACAVAYPSLDEGFGLPVLEALACGAPSITTSGTAMEEVAGGAALLVPPGDVVALADALATLIDDDATARALSAAGPARAAEYTWTASIDSHLDAYALATGRAA